MTAQQSSLSATTLEPLCGAGFGKKATAAPLHARNIDLVFVVSPDLAYHAPGDVAADTATASTHRSTRAPTSVGATPIGRR